LTYGNSKKANEADKDAVLVDILSPGIVFDSSSLEPTSITPNYNGTYFVSDDSCFKEFNAGFKGPYAEMFQIFLNLKSDKK